MQPGKKQRVQTIEFLLEKKKPFEANNMRQLIITKKIIEMIAADAMPFRMINNVGFTRFLNELEPRYVIPSEVHLSRTLIPDLYSAVKSKIVILLEQAAYISFTSDVWMSTNNLNAFISLTAHWVDSKWNRMSIVLSLRNLEDRHTGQVISDNILAMLAAWSIPDEKRGVLVRDNGASMKKAAELSGLDHLGCFTHTIQLVVKVGLLSQRSVMDAIVIARAIVGRFWHSTQATEQLLRIQKSLTCEDGTPYPTHRVIQDVTTRWNSMFYMLERLIEQKKAIALYCQENDGVTNLTAHEWNLMERVLITLRPFEQETRNASMSTATASMIIPSVRVLMATLTKPARVGDDIGIQTMRADMLKDLHTRYEEVETNKLCALATVLDPTCKLLVFNAHGHGAVKRMLMDELQIEYEKTITAVNIPASTEVDPGPSTSTGLDSYYQELLASITSDQNLASASLSSEFTCQRELDSYLAEKNQPRTSPPTDPVMCTSSQRNDPLNAFINVLFTALVVLYHILPGNIVDAFQTSGCTSGLFLHVNPETRTRVCCKTVPLPKGFEYVSCEVNGGYDRIAKCPDGLYQVDNTTTASEARCSSEIECNPDENLKISDCDAQGHCIFFCICNYDKGYCGPNFYDCQSFPSDCPRKWVQKDCTCKWKPTASTGSTLGNATNKPVQKIITTPSTVDGKSKTTEKKDRTLTGEEDQVLPTIKNNETGFIPDQKQRGLQHYEIIMIVLFPVAILACIIGLAVYCWKSKRNREYQSVGYSDGPSNSSSDTDDKPDIAMITLATEKEIDQANDNSSNHDGGGSRSDTDNRQPDNAMIPPPPNKVIDHSDDNSSNHDGGGISHDTENRQPDDAMITPPPNKVLGSRERPVAHVKPQPNITAQAHLISGLSTTSDHVRYTSEPSAADGYMNQISFSEQSTLTMEGYSEFTWSLRDNSNEETALLPLDNQQEQDDMRSEQQSSDETHTKELHQIAINNMEDGNVASEQQPNDETHTKELHQIAINNIENGNVASEQQSSDDTHTEELHQVAINNMEDGHMASEQQSSDDTHTEELHQVAINNMEDGNVASDIYVPEDESLPSHFSSGIYRVTNA